MSGNKQRAMERKKRKSSARLKGKNRVTICRSNKHFRAWIVDADGLVRGGVSTLTPAVKKSIKYSGNKDAAKAVGIALAAIIKKLKLNDNLAFDRSGYKYHGRVAMIAEGLRSENIKI